jgi:hypothetical protein
MNKEFTQRTLGYPGLNSDDTELGVKVRNTVKFAQIEDNALIVNGVATAIAPVLSRAHRINRHPPLLRNLQYRGYLFVVRGLKYSGNGAGRSRCASAKTSRLSRYNTGFTQNGHPVDYR